MSSGPIITTTPAKPSTSPATRPGVIFSSWVTKCATTTVNSGMVALKMDARPLAMCVCPQKRRLKGMTLLMTPMTKKPPIVRQSTRTKRPEAVRITISIAAAPRCG